MTGIERNVNMEDLEKRIWGVVESALLGGIKTRLEASYNNPLDKIIDGVVLRHSEEIKTMMDDLFSAAIRSDTFKASASEYLAHKVAKSLLGKMEGAIEKCANTLRSDPTTRAKLLIAIENIVKENQPEIKEQGHGSRA